LYARFDSSTIIAAKGAKNAMWKLLLNLFAKPLRLRAFAV
jgi:hypothetical protein